MYENCLSRGFQLQQNFQVSGINLHTAKNSHYCCRTCNSIACKGKACRKSTEFKFKAVSATDDNKTLYQFPGTIAESNFDAKYFSIEKTASGNKLILNRTINTDKEIELKIKKGRSLSVVRVFVFVSKYSF